jgi:outer membrane protein assembly factor BamB
MSVAISPSPIRARHRWFPWLVLAAAAAWYVRQATIAQYQTLLHFLVALVSVALISLWYVRYGGAAKRTRQMIVGGVWLGMLGFILLLRPVYNGDMGIFSWRLRFGRDADERLTRIDAAGKASDWQPTPRDYPGFLGGGYWAEVKGYALATDWKSHPPVEVWRREIGAGWSAFAVVGNYAVTQEQRGDREMVSCYRLDTGEPVWVHADEVRFDPSGVADSLGGVGPRATPTIHGERILTQGATGIVNCLDALTGEVLWSHDTAKKFGATVALWGKSGSPLVVDDLVIISVGAPFGEAASAAAASPGKEPYDSSLVAFDVETGDVRWAAGSRKAAYASPVVAELAGERQIVMVNESYVTAHRASDGKVLWEHPWGSANDTTGSASQPVPLPGDRLFLSKGYGVGSSLLSIRRNSDEEFAVEPVWKPAIKRVMKTKLCNVVVRDGFAYGLDEVLLECIELETGKVMWKNRRSPEFGHGQIMLIGDVILVLSEFGELALVAATPERYEELASMQVLDDAHVTWNNPAFAPPYLLVRNAREAACYRLPLKD